MGQRRGGAGVLMFVLIMRRFLRFLGITLHLMFCLACPPTISLFSGFLLDSVPFPSKHFILKGVLTVH